MLSPLRYQLVKIIFWCECVLFVFMYVHGDHGLQSLWRAQKENVSLAHERDALAADVAALEKELALWDKQSFPKEKIARETLHMARPGDKVYYWS